MDFAAIASLGAPAAAFVPQGGHHLRHGAAVGSSKAGERPSTAAAGQACSGFATAGLAAAGIVAGAAVLRPRVSARRTERKASTEYRGPMVGVCLPLTEKFDPLDLGNTDAKMDRYTAVEIKHGRISMIAVMGYILPEVFRFPGCEDFKSGLGALGSIPLEGWIQLVALIGAHEALVKPREGGMGIYDFGLGTELLVDQPDEEIERKQTVERNNGRLAMVAILGLMWQDGTFGQNPIAMLKTEGFWGPGTDYFVRNIGICQGNMCALPTRGGKTCLRATDQLSEGMFIEIETYPENPEMSPAVPFLRYPRVLKGWAGGEKGFDPLGVTDALPVYLVREAELKHGRICMLATLGWIATDLGARFPGEKFQAVQNSVEAHDKMVEAGIMGPFLGAIATVELYSLWLILKGNFGEIVRESGDYFVGKQFMPKDPEKENDMRLKELENGRLAMLAFSGICTQAVITGKPFPF
eukprot:TRINITY_DN135_c0_g1_i9.p1 TRINITY_DN135_c0_g1~~TRINITY_DN135_c0_g1_i9.p1  ORF type:complete len:468 (+),score=94.99 TRINITY_DN135_c0_g1_i9:49-1452(+)